MNSFGIARMTATSLVLGLALSGCGGLFGKKVASAADDAPVRGEGGAHAGMSKDLAKLISQRKGEKAVKLGEDLVQSSPRNAAYRMQLGEAYLLAGRFYSAETSFADALALAPNEVRAALKLSLVKAALGKKSEAQNILAQHRSSMSSSDYGLALALAGEPEQAVSVLADAARSPGADARTRQNLALAHALAGNWSDARVVASQDLSPADVDARMTQWAQFATPRSSWDQVASLLGVQPVSDRGQPVKLALNARSAASPQFASAEPAEEAAPAAFEIASSAPPAPATRDVPPVFEISSAAPQPYQPAPVAAAPRQVEAPMIMASRTPAKRKPIVEYSGKGKPPAAVAKQMAASRAPAPVAKAAAKPASAKPMMAAKPAAPKAADKPVKLASAAPVSTGGSRYVVQLGAYSSAKAADQAWSSMKGKVSALGGYTPVKTSVAAGGSSLQRLTVSGIASKQAADELCSKVKASGGNCFVRIGNEGAPVQMAAKKPAVKVAAKPQTKTVAKVASR